MVRYLLLLFVILFTSCMRYNEYGAYRVGISKFSITPNKNNRVYTIIDTNAIYRFINDERINISEGTVVPRYVKFYANGRIAEFQNHIIDIKKDTVLEAKKGYMGYYNFDEKDFIIQFYNSNWNASELMTEKLSVKNDTIIMFYQGSKTAQKKSFFVKEVLAKNIKITQPDW